MKKALAIFSLSLVLIVTSSSFIETKSDNFQKSQRKCFYKGSEKSKKVALTFDDGPDRTYSLEIAKILVERNVPATFFFIGKHIERHPTIAAMVYQAGFEIGNHTYGHLNLAAISESKIEEEITRTGFLIKEITGKEAVLFRPPYGKVNSTSLKVIRRHNLIPVTWSVDSEDWNSNTLEKEIISNVEENVRAGSIILLHSINAKTLRVLPKIIDKLNAMGYRFCSVSEMIVETEMEKFSRSLSIYLKQIGIGIIF